jgi:hypothetical protein
MILETTSTTNISKEISAIEVQSFEHHVCCEYPWATIPIGCSWVGEDVNQVLLAMEE